MTLEGGKSHAPIALFVYRRPVHTARTVASLQANDGAQESDLFVFCDGPKHPGEAAKVRETRELVKRARGFQSVTVLEEDMNQGLARSVIQGVSLVLRQSPRVVVVEDDLITTRDFLSFLNGGLRQFENDARVFSICGYSPARLASIESQHDAVCSFRFLSWGWATWRDRWAKADWGVADFEEFNADRRRRAALDRGGNDLSRMLSDQMAQRIDSWAIRWAYTQSKHNAVSIVPVRSRVINIGLDGSGTHASRLPPQQAATPAPYSSVRWPEETVVIESVEKLMRSIFYIGPIRRIARRLRLALRRRR
jgi:hypothetical protein